MDMRDFTIQVISRVELHGVFRQKYGAISRCGMMVVIFRLDEARSRCTFGVGVAPMVMIRMTG